MSLPLDIRVQRVFFIHSGNTRLWYEPYGSQTADCSFLEISQETDLLESSLVCQIEIVLHKYVRDKPVRDE